MRTFFSLETSINLSDAKKIEKQIDHENEVRPHMIHVHASEIVTNIQTHGGIIARCQHTGKLAGMVKLAMLEHTNPLYEWGSLFVMPDFRGMKLGGLLIREVVIRYRSKALVMVTNVPSVIAVSTRDPNQIQLDRTNMDPGLLKVVEGPQPLLPDDRVFINHTTSQLITSGGF